MRRGAPLIALVAATALMYGWGVGRNPVHLYVDEAVFGLQAHAIAATGHDASGRLFPIYFQMPLIAEYVWFQPAIVYVTAAFLKAFPLSEAAIRWPSVAIGSLDVLLMFFIARRLFRSDRWAWLLAVLLALTPSHFIHSRMAMDYLYPVPFVMGWLFCLIVFVDDRNERVLFLGATLLGLGLFSYVASLIMMPVYAALTFVALWRIGAPRRAFAIAAAGFAWPLLIVVPWLLAHPAVFSGTMQKYQVGTGTFQPRSAVTAGATLADTLQALRRPSQFSDVIGRASLAWYYLDPAYLFLSGGYVYVANETRRVAVFLMPMIVFVPAGLAYALARRRELRELLLLLGFVTAPLAAVLVVPEPYAIYRELELLPFGVLVAGLGIRAMLAFSKPVRWAALALLVLVPLNFLFFSVDYWRDYPARLAYAFQGNRPAALESIIARAEAGEVPSVFLSKARIPYIEAHWRFFLVKHHREDLLDRTHYTLSSSDLNGAPRGSLVLTSDDDAEVRGLAGRAVLRKIASIPEPGNLPLFALYER